MRFSINIHDVGVIAGPEFDDWDSAREGYWKMKKKYRNHRVAIELYDHQVKRSVPESDFALDAPRDPMAEILEGA